MTGDTTRLAIVDRINSLVCSAPFAFTPAKEVFSFRLQPATNVDATYCLLVEGEQSDGYLGLAQAQIDRVTLRLARSVRRTGLATVAQLYADVTSLQSAVCRDGQESGVYSGDVEDWRLAPPGETDAYVVAELDLLIDYDLAL